MDIEQDKEEEKLNYFQKNFKDKNPDKIITL